MLAQLAQILGTCNHGREPGACVLCALDTPSVDVIISPASLADAVANGNTPDGAAQAVASIDLGTIADEAGAAELRRRIEEELCRRSLFEFFSAAWREELGSEALDAAPHVMLFCGLVQAMIEAQLVAYGKATPEMRERVEASWRRHGLVPRQGALLVQNLIANLPPSTLKSSILMVAAPAWAWLHWPEWSVACTSGVKENVDRDSNAHRDLVESEWYRSTFQITWSIRKEVDSIGKWETTAGGVRVSKKFLGSWTGIHVDAIFVDDPDDAEQVHSEPLRKRTHNKWRRAIRNRIKHGDLTIRIIIQQRVHVDDLSGYLLGKGTWAPRRRGRWAWFCLPLEYGRGPRNAPHETPFGIGDWRTTDGEVLHPARFSPDMIADERVEKGAQDFESQYNQNPEPVDGGIFPRGRVRYFRFDDTDACVGARPQGAWQGEPLVVATKSTAIDLRAFDWITLTVDATFGALGDGASAVACTVVAGKDQRRFVLDSVAEPMTFSQTKRVIIDMIRKWPLRRVLIEKKANGASILEDLEDLLANGEIVETSEGSGTFKRRPILGPNGKPAVVPLEDTNPGSESKLGRARAMVPAFEAGLVYLLDGSSWIDKWLQEICTFPFAKRDDQVDALSQCLSYYRADGVAARRARALGSW